ncbi:MAG: hypothetical protein ACUZ8E_17855 [Candidatus Anammoxibacter sp.]
MWKEIRWLLASRLILWSFKLIAKEMSKEGIEHGDDWACNTCGSSGVWDIIKNGVAEFKNALWYNNHIKEFECYYCYLK